MHAVEKNNAVISSLSVKLVLMMLYEGALGNTAKQIENTVGFTDQKQIIRERYSQKLESLQVNYRINVVALQLLNMNKIVLMDLNSWEFCFTNYFIKVVSLCQITTFLRGLAFLTPLHVCLRFKLTYLCNSCI